MELFKVEEKTIVVDDTKILLKENSPLVQAEIIKKMQGIDKADVIKNTELLAFYFNDIVKTVNFKGVEYKGGEFFKMLSLVNDDHKSFIAQALAKILENYFATSAVKKK